MPACFVTGIVPTEDIAELETLLGSVPGVDHSKLTVITKAERSDEHDSSFLNFIHSSSAQIDRDAVGGIAGDASLITGGGGTGVPGLDSATPRLGFLESPKAAQHVGNLPIPPDEAGNYIDAIEEGRSVVAYQCSDADTAALEAAFRNAGAKRVKTFEG